jgi:hypothetical protein
VRALYPFVGSGWQRERLADGRSEWTCPTHVQAGIERRHEAEQREYEATRKHILAREQLIQERKAQRLESARIEGVLIIFTRDFEPKGTFVDSILTKMKARDLTYRDWMSADTPVTILVHPSAQDATVIAAQATVQFRMMGIVFSAEKVESATFEGDDGISGSVVTHWSAPR